MAEYQMVVGGFLNNPLTGRRPIETPETEINRENVLKVVMGKAEPIHLLNKNEIRFLHNYYLGSQPVLYRTKEYHAEITNRIVENHANECVGFYTGYMSGTPCSYVRSETATGDGEEIARLSNALQYEGKDALDRRLWQWMLFCFHTACNGVFSIVSLNCSTVIFAFAAARSSGKSPSRTS